MNTYYAHSINDLPEIKRKEYLLLFPFYLFFTLLTFLVIRNSFFWDKDIIFSRIAFWLLDNKFSLVLPDSLDVGYPPLLGYLLASVWLIAGKSLWITHLLMLPFSIGLVVQIYRLLRYYMPVHYIYPIMILVFADTTLLSQSIVYSTDLVMLFFLLLSINSVLYNKRIILSIAVFGLFFSHARGVTGVIMVALFDLYKIRIWDKPLQKISMSFAYLPGMVLFAGYCIFHFTVKGWIGYHENSPWIGCFELVDGKGFLRNIFIVAWRLVDYGKLFVVLVLFFLSIRFIKTGNRIDTALADLLLLLGLAVLTCVPSALVYKVLNSHRYFLPITIIATVISGYLLYRLISGKNLKRVLYILMLAGLISGNFWTYPDTIAKGWDGTLAHVPYYKLRNKMLAYIDEKKIPFSEIGTETPNNYPLKFYDLSEDSRFIAIKDFQQNRYIFYSNIYNMFTDQEIATLKNHWLIEKEFRCLLVRVTLYKNPR